MPLCQWFGKYAPKLATDIPFPALRHTVVLIAKRTTPAAMIASLSSVIKLAVQSGKTAQLPRYLCANGTLACAQ